MDMNAKLIEVLRVGEDIRRKAREAALEKLTPRERRLVSEALVAGYLACATTNVVKPIPKDSAIVAEGLSIALTYKDLYPTLADYEPSED